MSTQEQREKRQEQLAADARYNEFERAACDAVARVAMELVIQGSYIVRKIGYANRDHARLLSGITEPMESRAADMLADAFCSDAIRSIVAEFAFGDNLSGDRANIYLEIVQGLENMGEKK